jgi:hypothetical protein
MVVLDQRHVVKPEAMIAPAAAGDGIFLEAAPTGRRLARVENLRAAAFDGLNELRRQRGHAGKALNKIERDAFGGKQSTSRTFNSKQRLAGLDRLPIRGDALDLYGRRKFLECGFGERQPGSHKRFAGVHRGTGDGRVRHRRQRGHVPGADVLGQGTLHRLADFLVAQRIHRLRMANV